MPWRYIACALLGGLLGFAGQFLADEASPNGTPHSSDSPSAAVSITSNIPSGLPGDAPYVWAYRYNGRSLGTPYQLMDRTLAYPGVPNDVPKSFAPSTDRKSEWQQLWCQLMFLDWLKKRGDVASLMAAVAATLALLFALLADRLHKNWSARKASIS